jgi:signal transduction histidine kinase
MNNDRGQILVVDDNRMNRLKLSLSLEQQGHQVGMAEDGVQALEMLKHQPFDVVLLDILMPGMDGFQVLEQMKSRPELRDIPVIVISALDDQDSAVRCIENGAEDYLTKPFNPVLLRARLNASLQKKKLRDLEKAYLQQELMLRQSEKLATLGKLSAGMAHELNNPAAAAQRSAGQLLLVFSRLQENHVKLSQFNLSPKQSDLLLDIGTRVQKKTKEHEEISPLERSDLEYQIETWLQNQGVENAWELAPFLVNVGYSIQELETLKEDFPAPIFQTIINWADCLYQIYTLLEEIGLGASRIAEIVKALKSYTYLDQAPTLAVNIHEGLDNTLVILRSKLKQGITVHREYAKDLPTIQAYGSELNQVWTNLIDNAIDAMDGQGEIILRTSFDEQWVTIEVEDHGHGIPESILIHIFDPFFTTKPVGQGTGLGLNISHNIIVHKHNGQLEVQSQPGKTVFTVRLPRNFNPADAATKE